MLVAEYSYEEDIQVKQEEARQEGLSIGLSQGLSCPSIPRIIPGLRTGRTENIVWSGPGWNHDHTRCCNTKAFNYRRIPRKTERVSNHLMA